MMVCTESIISIRVIAAQLFCIHLLFLHPHITPGGSQGQAMWDVDLVDLLGEQNASSHCRPHTCSLRTALGAGPYVKQSRDSLSLGTWLSPGYITVCLVSFRALPLPPLLMQSWIVLFTLIRCSQYG